MRDSTSAVITVSDTLLATATCRACGSTIRLFAESVPDSLGEVVDTFRDAFRSCPACGSDSLDFTREVSQ